MLLTLLAGCQPQRPVGTLVVGHKSRIDSLDPAKASRSGQMQVLSALGDPLYVIRADGRIEPRLATALPRLSADGLRARIPLRTGVVFHDGTRFDADAMVFSLRRFLGIGTLGYQLSERVRDVHATGPHEIELELRRPFGPLPRLLSAIFLTPVSPTAYRRYRDKPFNDRFVGTGPYRLSFFSNQQQRLTPFQGYWGRRPANRGLALVTLSNSTALLGALRSGEVDVLLSSGMEIDHQQALHQDARAGRLKEAVGPSMEIGFISLLSDQPPLATVTVRQAIAHSLIAAPSASGWVWGCAHPCASLCRRACQGRSPRPGPPTIQAGRGPCSARPATAAFASSACPSPSVRTSPATACSPSPGRLSCGGISATACSWSSPAWNPPPPTTSLPRGRW